MENEPGILVVSRVEEQTYKPLVEVFYQGKSVVIGAMEAIRKAIAIFNAAAYAESEVALFKSLTSDKPSKGFGRPQISQEYETALKVIQLVRTKRQSLPEGVNGIFGFKTQEPLVDLDYGVFKMQLYLQDARHHASTLLQASEAAQFDAFWFNFATRQLDFTQAEVQALVTEYRVFKERYSIEAIFNQS